MSAPVLDDATAIDKATLAGAAAEWRRVALPLGLGILLLGALFNQEIEAAVRTWNASTAYNHCYLIIPITLYLLWDRRLEIVGIAPRPMPAAVLFGVPLAIAWLGAERLGIMEGRQLVALSFVELLLLAILGKRLWWAIAGPLLYLYFLVPFGEFLTPKLQDITTWFIRNGLEALGIPAYIDGYIIEIPQGTFFVAEACAGLRFLIASIAFGCLYALLMYRSPLRRGVFILVSILVPIVANGFRGLGIVYLGYLLNSAKAAAADHIIYGWVFFSAVILLLIVFGLPFRQDDRSAPPPGLLAAPPGPPMSLRGVFAVALAVAIVASLSPTVAAALTMATEAPAFEPASIDASSGCTERIARSSDGRVVTQHLDCGGLPMDMTWEAFSPRITAAPLMAERRLLVKRAETESLQENWLDTADGSVSAWRIMTSNEPAFAIAVSIWVDGKPVRPSLTMRARMAMDSLFGSTFAPMVVTITPMVAWESLTPAATREASASVAEFLRNHPDLDDILAASTAR